MVFWELLLISKSHSTPPTKSILYLILKNVIGDSFFISSVTLCWHTKQVWLCVPADSAVASLSITQLNVLWFNLSNVFNNDVVYIVKNKYEKLREKAYEIFGEYEKENASLKVEMNKLRGELSASVESGKLKDCDIIAYKSLVSQAEIEKLGLEDQNRVLHKQISKLKDIKLSSMEEKLNRTIDLLNQLTESVVENRAISYAVGDTICGADRFKTYVDKAKEDLRNE